MELILSDARPLDFLETLDDAGAPVGRRGRRQFGLQARQVEGGTSITVRTAEGQLVLMFGLYPAGPDQAEAWIAAGPALRANLRAGMAATKDVLEFIGAEAAPLAVAVYIHPSSVAGGRLAAWLGFVEGPMASTPLGLLRSWTRRFS